MKIGLLGGSFDPLHFGHLNLAIEMAEHHQLDEIWFYPASISPHKTNHTIADSFARLQMLELAISDLPQFKALDIELKRKPPSYTIDTLRAILDEHKESSHHFYLIIGADAVPQFHLWHHAEEIVSLTRLLVGQRGHEFPLLSPQCPQKVKQAIEEGLTPTKIIDVSSTEIRERLSKHLYCSHLVPAKVLDFIRTHHLYLKDQNNLIKNDSDKKNS